MVDHECHEAQNCKKDYWNNEVNNVVRDIAFEADFHLHMLIIFVTVFCFVRECVYAIKFRKSHSNVQFLEIQNFHLEASLEVVKNFDGGVVDAAVREKRIAFARVVHSSVRLVEELPLIVLESIKHIRRASLQFECTVPVRKFSCPTSLIPSAVLFKCDLKLWLTCASTTSIELKK